MATNYIHELRHIRNGSRIRMCTIDAKQSMDLQFLVCLHKVQMAPVMRQKCYDSVLENQTDNMYM